MLETLQNINSEILNARHRLLIVSLIMINIVAAGLEALSVYLFLPILEFFKSPQDYQPENFLPPVLVDFVGNFGHLGFGTFILLIIVFLLKTMVMTLISFSKNSIITGIRRDISILVFAQSIFQNYKDLVNTKISVLMNNVTIGISHLSNGILFSSINIVIELFTIAAITVVLIINTSLLSLLVPLIVGIIGFVLLMMFKRWASQVGRIRQKAEASRMQILRESYASVLEIKIYRSEAFFVQLIQDEEQDIKKSGSSVLTMTEIPKYVLEFLGVLTIFCFFLISYKFGETDNLLMTNGLFAVAIIKLMPSLNRIIISYNTMRAAIPAYLQVADIFSNSMRNPHLTERAEARSAFQSISSLRIKNLTYYYSENSRPVISGMNFTLKKGQIYGLIGPSGSGKTTLLNILSGVLRTTNTGAQFFINGKLAQNYSDEIQGHIGYVPQSPQLLNKTIAENVAFDQPAHLIDRNRVEKVLALAEASKFVQGLPFGIDHVLSDAGMNLSGGQRQRLALARALYRHTSIIILDEATNALDQKTANEFMTTISHLSQDSITIVVSHSSSMIKFCDEVLAIHGDKIDDT